jgi:hypothetical protein
MHGINIFDFKKWAAPMRDEINENAKQIAQKNNKDQKTLAPIYEELVRTLSHAFKPNNIAMFLGKRLDPRFEGELGEQFPTRIEGHSIRHYMNKSGTTMYDKFGFILRVESFSNDISLL